MKLYFVIFLSLFFYLIFFFFSKSLYFTLFCAPSSSSACVGSEWLAVSLGSIVSVSRGDTLITALLKGNVRHLCFLYSHLFF